MGAQIKAKQVQGLQSTLDALIGIDKISETFTTTATDGDTGILITQSARETDAIQVFVNGQKLQEGYSWKKGGSAITASSLEANTELVWSSSTAGYDLDSLDEIQIEYETLTSGNASLSGGGSGISGDVTGHLIPDAHEAYDLGRADKKFRDLYLSDSTIYMGGNPLSITNGVLTLNGNPVSGNPDTYTTTESNTSGIDRTLAFTVSDSTTGGMMSPNQDRVFVENGAVNKVYRLQGGTWAQEGSDIPFISVNQLTSYGNGQRRWSHDGNHISFWDSTANILRVYSWNGSDWQQRGSDISGTSFKAHDINQDGTRIVLRDGTALNAIIYTYDWNGTAWIQQPSINWGYTTGTNLDVTGNKLLLSSTASGYGTSHTWNGTAWVQDNMMIGQGGFGEWSGDGTKCWTIGSQGQTGSSFIYDLASQADVLTYTYPETARVSFHLNDNGTTALVSDYINNKWYIAKDNGSGSLVDNTVGYPTPTNSPSANADVTKVIDNEGVNTENFYLYTIGNSLNVNAYLDTSTLSVGDITLIYSSVSLAYTPVQTAHIYQDVNNWIRVRVIQNTTSQDNLLQVKVLEKQGDVFTTNYSITLG